MPSLSSHVFVDTYLEFIGLIINKSDNKGIKMGGMKIGPLICVDDIVIKLAGVTAQVKSYCIGVPNYVALADMDLEHIGTFDCLGVLIVSAKDILQS